MNMEFWGLTVGWKKSSYRVLTECFGTFCFLKSAQEVDLLDNSCTHTGFNCFWIAVQQEQEQSFRCCTSAKMGKHRWTRQWTLISIVSRTNTSFLLFGNYTPEWIKMDRLDNHNSILVPMGNCLTRNLYCWTHRGNFLLLLLFLLTSTSLLG